MIRRPPRSTRTDTLFPYTTLFRSRYRQTVSQSGLESSDSYIVSRARVPSAPSSPNMLIYAAMAVVGGLGIGVLLVVLLQLLERGLETSDAIEGTLGLATLASIPDPRTLPGYRKPGRIGRAACRERGCQYV